MICPNCHHEITPRPENNSFDYGESHQGPAGTHHVDTTWECPMCDTELDAAQAEAEVIPEPDFDDCQEPDYDY